MNPVPFDLPDVGLREISGMLYVEMPYLVFEVTDGLLGEFDKDKQVIKIELNALDEVSLKLGVVRDKIIIRPKKSDLLEVIPGNYNDELVLKVWKTNRSETEAVFAAIQSLLLQKNHGRVTGG